MKGARTPVSGGQGSLEGRVAIITGGLGGLGSAYARKFAREGAHLVLSDREAASATDLIAELGGSQVATFLPGDIGQEGTAEALIDHALEKYGRLDVLVNNAGNFMDRAITETDVAGWDDLIRVNLRATFLACRAAARHWRDRQERGVSGDASIINTTSRSALNAIDGHSGYAAAKSGVITFSAIAAKEFSAFGVRVNCVAPAARTPMSRGIAAMKEALDAPVPEGEFDELSPDNVAPLVAYLAEEGCPLTGQVIFARGSTLQTYRPWEAGEALDSGGRWDTADIGAALAREAVGARH